MAFPFSLLMTWLGAALLWVAFHGTGATTPWGVYQEILGKGAAIPPGTGGSGNASGQQPGGPNAPASSTQSTLQAAGKATSQYIQSGNGNDIATDIGQDIKNYVVPFGEGLLGLGDQ